MLPKKCRSMLQKTPSLIVFDGKLRSSISRSSSRRWCRSNASPGGLQSCRACEMHCKVIEHLVSSGGIRQSQERALGSWICPEKRWCTIGVKCRQSSDELLLNCPQKSSSKSVADALCATWTKTFRRKELCWCKFFEPAHKSERKESLFSLISRIHFLE